MVRITKEDVERLVEEYENEKHGSVFLGFLLGAIRLLRLCQQKGVVVDVAAALFLNATSRTSAEADLKALAIETKRLRELREHK